VLPRVPRFPLWNGTQFLYVLTRMPSITRQNSNVFSISRKNRDKTVSEGKEMESMCKTLPFGRKGPLKGLPTTRRLKVAWVQLRTSFQQYVIQHTCIHHGSKPSNRGPNSWSSPCQRRTRGNFSGISTNTKTTIPFRSSMFWINRWANHQATPSLSLSSS